MGLRIHIYAKLFIYTMQLKPCYHLEESQRQLIILNQKKKKSQRHEISSDFRYIICKFLNFNKYISFQIYDKKVIKLIIYYVVDELLIAFITISIYIYF